ncbi:MAG: LacI family DNA-binding transcriptional regulator [Eubacteriales bacterium]|nr:LacI family DNA-binding transcriptional regulator [Eubacteriales bacterium]
MSNVTIVDIAKEANVSIATVSRVLNNNGRVSDKTKKRILDIIKKRGYVPSVAARALSSQHSRAIGVLIPNPTAYFFSRILDGVSSVADKNNYVLIFCNTENSPAKELNAIQMLANQHVAGLIITPAIDQEHQSENTALLEALEELRIPVVFVDRKLNNAAGDAVLFNNYQGAFIATEALIQSGCKNIGAIIPDQKLQLGIQRYRGYSDAIAQHHPSNPSDYTLTVDYSLSINDAYQLSKKLLKKLPKGSGVLLSNGTVSKGFLKALWETPLILGEDIVCVGFDKLELLDYMKINFNYVDRSEIEMGQLAAEMLLERINNDLFISREYIIPAKLHAEFLGKTK